MNIINFWSFFLTLKIQKIIIKTTSQQIQDDPFNALLRCRDLLLEEIEICCPINPIGFKSFCENKKTWNLKMLCINFSNFSEAKKEFTEIISNINADNFPKLDKLIIFCRPSFSVPFDQLFGHFNNKLHIELNIVVKNKFETCDFELKISSK